MFFSDSKKIFVVCHSHRLFSCFCWVAISTAAFYITVVYSAFFVRFFASYGTLRVVVFYYRHFLLGLLLLLLLQVVGLERPLAGMVDLKKKNTVLIGLRL